MHVGDITATEVADGIEWSARVTFADQERTVRFGGPADLVSHADATPFLAATLLPAMAWQQDLEIDGPVSPRVLARVGQLARSFHAMDATLRIPEVRASAEGPARSQRRGIACFFSRGVDSTYSAAVDRVDPGPLEALVYCRTLEPNHSPATSSEELERTRASAAAVGLPLHVLWTDLRSFTDPMLGWSTMHGSGLSALALMVGQAFDHLVIPSAYDVATLPPGGSYPVLDPLWSSEAIQIHHDHLDRDRQRKIDWLVAHRPDLLAHLKVCYTQDGNDNCGRCHKCALTMASLRAAQALHLAPTFPAELDLDVVRAQRRLGLGLRSLWIGVHRQAEAVGDVDLRDAVADLLHHHAVPPIKELVGGRWPLLDRVLGQPDAVPNDPEIATSFERFDRRHTERTLALLRHGQVLPHDHQPPPAPPATPLRAATVVGSLAASLRHRREQRRAGRVAQP